MRRLTIGTFLVAALLALAVGTVGLLRSGSDDAVAQTGILEPGDPDPNGPGTIYQVAIDTDITGNVVHGVSDPAVIQGALDPCLSVSGPVGTQFTIDLLTDEVSPSDGLAGAQSSIAFDGTQVQVISYILPTGAGDFTTGGSGGIAGAPTLPDNNGPFTPAWSNFGASGDGEFLVGRVTFETVNGGVGFTDLTAFGDVFVSASTGDPVPVQQFTHGQIFINQNCPTPTDLEPTINSVTGLDPIAVSNTEIYTADVNVTDNGPELDAVNYDLTIDVGAGSSAAFLADCTTNLPITVGGTIAADPNPQTTNHLVNFNVHCTDPSAHDFEITATVTRVNPVVADTVPGNDTDVTSPLVNLDVTAISDLNISAQTVVPAFNPFLVDNSVDMDGDTLVDEDPVNGIDDDGDTLVDEDGGTVVPIFIDKTVDNLGPYGPTAVTDVMAAIQANPNAAPCGISLSPAGPFTGGPVIDNDQQSIPALGSANFSYTIYLHCGPSGWGYDDDGDCVDANASTICDSHIDEDPPDGIDNDGDTLVDEDGPVALPVIVVDNCADSKDPHISDPTPEGGPILGSPHDTCEQTQIIMQGVHPFNPSGVITIDEVDNGLFTAPGDNDCLVTVPCKMQSYYLIPDGDVTAAHHTAGTAQDQGGSPLANVSIIEDATANLAFLLTHGNAIPDGDITTQINAAVTLRPFPGAPCATPGALTFTLADGDLGDAYGDTTPGDDDSPDPLTALGNPLSWSTKLDAVANYVTLVAFPGSVLHARNVGTTTVGATVIPINELIFDLGGFGVGPWLHFSVIGDPDNDSDGIWDPLDPDDDNDTIPDAQDTDSDGDGTVNSSELAQCSPLEVTQISLGTSQANAGLGTPGGTVLRTCQVINPINPPGSFGHTDVQNFTREDIGTTTTIPSQVGCSGENDAAASIYKDETPGDGITAAAVDPDGDTVPFQAGVDNDGDTQIDEDPTLDAVDDDGDGADGEDPTGDIVAANVEQHINVLFDVENGTVPGDLNVQFGIVGPSSCDPTWIGQAGDTVNTAVLGDVQTSTITRTETGMSPNEIRYFERKYSVSCPPGAHNFNIFNNVSSASGLPDPDLNNNQAENQLQIIATADVDNDTVPNHQDNCVWTPNPDQTDTDGDGIGDACDIDDDGDGIPDSGDACPLLPEDLDGVADGDGCPDTDVSVDVDKSEAYDVDVSESVNKTVTITVTNGNYPANVQTNILAVSTLGACEVRLIAQTGDTYSEFTTDEVSPFGIDDTLWSQIERTDFFNAGEVKVFVREYTIHCFQNSQHSFELAIDALPLNPVQEENLDDNVHKNFPTVTAYKKADLKKVSLTFNLPPASVKVGELFNLEVLGTIHNNGPTTGVNYADTLTVNLPGDCVAGGPTVFNFAGTMNTSVNTPIAATVTDVVCSEQSDHVFTADNVLTITTLHVRDPQTVNNTKSAQTAIVVNADADVKVQGVTVNAPADADVGVAFNVGVAATLHNNGPEDPVNVDVTYTLSVPADCTKSPNGNQSDNDLSLPASTATPVSKTWSVTCTEHSDHLFSGSVSAAVDQVHVIDPDTGNNSGSDDGATAVFRSIEKIVCDTYVGVGPVPPAPVGPAAGCPNPLPWNGGEDEISVNGGVVTVITDHLDYSSEAVNVKVTMQMTGIAGGPQTCAVTPADYVFNEAEPEGLSTGGSQGSFDIELPLPVHDGEPNWCVVEYTVTKEINELHTESTGSLTQTVQFAVARDTDGDGVFDNAFGDLDNCKLVPNADQTDTNGNTVGDACDDSTDVLEKYITVLGPAAVNLSDNNGRYMWVIGEMGNTSTQVQQVQITISINHSPALPDGCTEDIDLILPGQSTFLMLGEEQKFQVFRVRYECHAPATQQVITLSIEKCIDLLPSASHDDDGDGLIDEDSRDGVDNDGDSEDGEDPPNPDGNPANDCQTAEKQVIIDQP